MRKTIFLCFAAAAVLTACNKSESIAVDAQPGEIAMKSAIHGVTKAGELNGSSFDEKGYAMYVSASQYSEAGGSENPLFFNDQLFRNKPDGAAEAKAMWRHYASETAEDPSPLYWPVGGSSIDFLAYALPLGKKEVLTTSPRSITYNARVAAQDFTVADWDTYQNQIDLLYAAANGQVSRATGTSPYIKMDFSHAQALLIFNVSINQAASGLVVNDISFVTPEYIAQRNDELIGRENGVYNAVTPKEYSTCTVPTAAQVTLKTRGTFFVDNQRNDLVYSWSYEGLGDSNGVMAANWKMPDFASDPYVSACNIETPAITSAVKYGTALTSEAYVQLGETLLVPEQQAPNFCVTYTVGGNTLQYYYNVPRKVWAAGKKYVYNLDIDLNEIVITETVADFERVADTPAIR